jgi:cyclophilin family peptidyl-prolyl cis-trans isomerase
VLKFRANDLKHVRGAVSAVLRPGQPDSAGAQFFVCVSDQPTLDGHFTVFGRVVEGLEIAQQVSEMPADANGPDRRSRRDRDSADPRHAAARADAVRDRDGGAARRLSARPRDHDGRDHGGAVPGSRAGPRPQLPAPVEARRLRRHGVPPRRARLRRADRRALQPQGAADAEAASVRPEPAAGVSIRRRTTPGILSMARGDDPASAQTSFFICLGRASSLDNKYTVFGRVVDGMAVVEALAKVPLSGEEPVTRVEITRVRIVAADAVSRHA